MFAPYATYVRILSSMRTLAPSGFSWRKDAYEFVTDRAAIDLLTGGAEIREAIDAGVSVEPALVREAEAAARFLGERARWLRY